jgi:uncharacterized membrane protein
VSGRYRRHSRTPAPAPAPARGRARRSATRGTFLESHFRWQIRTFWYALLWAVVCGLLMITIIGIPFALIGLAALGIWIAYRVIRGWVALKDRRPMYV